MTVAASSAIRRPTADDVARLASIHQYPCVTILLPTRPATRLAETDRAVLSGLVVEAARRLRAERDPDAQVIADRIEGLVDLVAAGPTDAGLALLASADQAEAFHLTEVLQARVVVDPTFATRDLLATVQHNPSYWLLMMSSENARLFEHDGQQLRETTDGSFPMAAAADDARRAGASDGWRRQRELVRRFSRQVDDALATHLKRHRRPVVVMASDRTLAEYQQVTRHGDQVLGLARGGSRRPSLRVLESAVKPLLAEHLADLAAAAEDTLAARMRRQQVTTGLVACWQQAATRTPELLLVEQTFATPARLSADGLALQPATDREHPEVLDDAVDELIELVSARGGQVRFVPDGALHWAQRVALSVAN